ncbi:protein CLP1 homolog [Leptopilina heterotoma]|uniref:protein CLP1 homolog n=1 Tax=Leptopilina heterotoma TaxID=63436 RepID=UPI001CA9D481|nr:protein CLP1 homolog [Leptopilina heterotoma]
MMENVKKEYKLEPDSELRFEIESKSKKITIELKSGLAELFGTELVVNKKYTFSGTSVAVITWQGCTIEVEGDPDIIYTSKESPMTLYLNCHAVLERLRELSERKNEKGPITMIAGPCDVGKSTLSRMLVNYAIRMNKSPIYVNLDVGQAEFGLPGSVGAVIPKNPASVEGGFTEEAPLLFHFGSSSPLCNQTFYKLLTSRLAQVCNERMRLNRNERHSGIIINTCGCTKGDGYRILIHAAYAFEVDAILVIDQQQLYNDLLRDMPKFVKVSLLPKSSGVIKRNETQRAESRNSLIHNYFYGIPKAQLHPFKIELKFEDISIYRVTISAGFSSNMTVAKKSPDTTLMPVKPIPNMKNRLLSVSLAKLNQDDIVESNISGFLHVQDVNMHEKIMTVLSPEPKLTKNLVLLLSEVRYWNDNE